MSNNILKKEFRERDVNRIRNLLAGKGDQGTVTQVGYESADVKRKDGDVWVEGKITWTMVNGIKKSLSKLSSFRDAVKIPLACPDCKEALISKADTILFKIHGKCATCVAKYESQLKLEGKYEEYYKNIIKNNAIDFAEEAIVFMHSYLNENEFSSYTEDGTREEWAGTGNKKEIFKRSIEEIEKFKKEVSEL